MKCIDRPLGILLTCLRTGGSLCLEAGERGVSWRFQSGRGQQVWSIFPAYPVSFPLNCPAHFKTESTPQGEGVSQKAARSVWSRRTRHFPNPVMRQVPGLSPLTSSPSTGIFPEPSSSPSHWSHLCMSLPMSLMSLQCPPRSCWLQTQSLW